MTLLDLHAQLRTVLQARIQRGSISVSLLARKTALGQPQVSNFLHGHRRLSLQSLSRVLDALGLEVAATPKAQR